MGRERGEGRNYGVPFAMSEKWRYVIRGFVKLMENYAEKVNFIQKGSTGPQILL